MGMPLRSFVLLPLVDGLRCTLRPFSVKSEKLKVKNESLPEIG